LFSKSVADGILYYRQQKSNFHGSEQIENFTRCINDVFDALNARKPVEGLQKGTNQYKILVQFFEEICIPNCNFASKTTSEALKITIKSTLDLLDYFTSSVGFKYLLTAKLNQDYLEKFFGLIRSCGGDSDSPTATSFLQIYRLLSVHIPISKGLHGNSRQPEEHHHTLVSIENLLNDAKTKIQKANANRKTYVEEKILEKITCEEQDPSKVVNSSAELLEHAVSKKFKSSETSPIVFHLCGYLAHKAKAFTKCMACLNSLVDCDTENIPQAILTKAKSIGYLKYPSMQLYDIINNHVDPFVEKKLQEGEFIGDFIESLVISLNSFNAGSFGCSESGHGPKLLVRIIIFYISIRMHFFVRIFNKEQRNSSKEQKKFRKLSKLVTPKCK
ncbi:unnamed protein product, partial [Allacma fusca]